jgi:hypothetical protein
MKDYIVFTNKMMFIRMTKMIFDRIQKIIIPEFQFCGVKSSMRSFASVSGRFSFTRAGSARYVIFISC